MEYGLCMKVDRNKVDNCRVDYAQGSSNMIYNVDCGMYLGRMVSLGPDKMLQWQVKERIVIALRVNLDQCGVGWMAEEGFHLQYRRVHIVSVHK